MGKFISVKFLYQREYKFFLLLVNTAKLCPSLDLHKDSLDPQLVALCTCLALSELEQGLCLLHFSIPCDLW